MKFTVNRRIFLEYLKSMARIVPKLDFVKKLTGFLIEANENDGYLYLTANNQEAAIQRKLKPVIETGGEFVIDARAIIRMLTLLSETDVIFEEIKTGIIEIKCGECTYTIPVLSGKNYPRPDMPFPEDMVHVSGLRQMYSKTCSAAAKGDASQVLTGIHIDISPDRIRAVSCDLRGMAMAQREQRCGDAFSFTIPKESFSYLAGAIGNDDELDIGISGPFVIFIKEGLIFSAKRLMQEYVNFEEILNSIKPIYMAKVEYDEFKTQVRNICDIASLGSEISYVKLSFKKDKIIMETKNDVGSGMNECSAVMVDGKECCYYYPANMLKDILKTVEGSLIIQVDKRGYMMVFDKYNQYMLTPMREEAVQRQAEKFAAKIKELKTKAKSKKKLNAA